MSNNEIVKTTTFDAIENFESRHKVLSLWISFIICLCAFDKDYAIFFSEMLHTLFFNIFIPMTVAYLICAIKEKWWKNNIIQGNAKKWFDFVGYMLILLQYCLIVSGGMLSFAVNLIAANWDNLLFLETYVSGSFLANFICSLLLFITSFFTILFLLKKITGKYRKIFET